jgi:hypothetical protein
MPFSHLDFGWTKRKEGNEKNAINSIKSIH